MQITPLTLGPLGTNCYIVSADGSDEAVVIDPAARGDRIKAALGNQKTAAVLLTHGHFDHTGALADFSGCPIYIHPLDAQMLSDPRLSLAGMVGDRAPRPAATDYVNDGDILTLAGLQIRVFHTPGHTPGSVSYLIGDALFTGDTLFQGSCGRTDFPGGSWDDEMASIRKLLALPEDHPVYPGHGPETRLSGEKANY